MLKTFFPFLLVLGLQAALGATQARAQYRLGYVDVPGASLYYEVIGRGPLLVFISGQNGDADIWRDVASVLSANFTVAAYDRRGFSRSFLSLTTVQDYANRLARDADDVAALIKHLSPANATTAHVLGSSSGAIVAMMVLARHPDLLTTLVTHEPPAIMLLPDNATLASAQRDIYTTYRAAGVPAAMLKFALLFGGGGATTSASDAGQFGSYLDPRTNDHVWGNTQYWFERELLPYPLHEWDLATDFAAGGLAALLPAVGVETDPSAIHYRANMVLAKMCGTDAVVMPGGHIGYKTGPAAWGTALLRALLEKNGGKL